MPQVDFDALADRAIGKFEPAGKIWPPGIRLALWLGLELAIFVLVALVDRRPDLAAQLGNPRYLFQLGTFIVAGTVAAGLALRTAIPGREATRGELILLSFAAPIVISAILSTPVRLNVSIWQFLRAGTWCLGCTVALGALPWAILFWTVRRGAPFMVETEGALIGAAAFSFAFAASRLGCPIDDAMHILVWHATPVAAGTLLSISAGIAWLRRDAAAQIRIARASHGL